MLNELVFLTNKKVQLKILLNVTFIWLKFLLKIILRLPGIAQFV